VNDANEILFQNVQHVTTLQNAYSDQSGPIVLYEKSV
jgi:hypothetical protein